MSVRSIIFLLITAFCLTACNREEESFKVLPRNWEDVVHVSSEPRGPIRCDTGFTYYLGEEPFNDPADYPLHYKGHKNLETIHFSREGGFFAYVVYYADSTQLNPFVGGYFRIYHYDVSTRTSTDILGPLPNQPHAECAGDYIVFTVYGSIQVYNVQTKEHRTLERGGGKKRT